MRGAFLVKGGLYIDSQTYWRLREEEALKHYIKDEKEYDKKIAQIYSEMLDNIQKEIDSFYGKYASKEGITISEAKKRVIGHDVKAFERKAAKYVKEKDFSEKANEELRLYNATMRINRLELLKAQIGLETIAGHDELQKFLGSILKGRTMDELKRQAGILGKSLGNNAKAAHAIVNGSFHNGTFSDRIWQYQDLMRIELGKQLQIGLIQGKNPRAIARSLEKFWYGNDPLTGGGAVYCMERLMRTELARVQTEAQKQTYQHQRSRISNEASQNAGSAAHAAQSCTVIVIRSDFCTEGDVGNIHDGIADPEQDDQCGINQQQGVFTKESAVIVVHQEDHQRYHDGTDDQEGTAASFRRGTGVRHLSDDQRPSHFHDQACRYYHAGFVC